MHRLKVLPFVLMLGCSFLAILIAVPPPAVFAVTAPSLDTSGTYTGMCNANPGSTCTFTLSPSATNDLIIIAEATTTSGGENVPTCSTCGTNTFGASLHSAAYVKDYQMIDTASTSTTITCNSASSNYGLGCVGFLIKGESLTAPFDPGANAYCTSQPSVPKCRITTTVSNDFVFAVGAADMMAGDGTPAISVTNGTTIKGPETYQSHTGLCSTYACGTLDSESYSAASPSSQTVIFSETGDYQSIIGEAVEALTQVTAHVSLTVQEGGATTGTFAISGSCDSNDSTVAGDGLVHGVKVDPSCVMTFTVPSSPPANTIYRFNASATTGTYTTCASGSCSAKVKFYYYWEIGFTFEIVNTQSISFDSGLSSFVPTGTLDGTAASNLCTLSPSGASSPKTCTSTPTYYDYGTTVTYNFPATLGNPPTNVQWPWNPACSSTGSPTAGSTISCTYYKQLHNTYKISSNPSVNFIGGLGNVTVYGTNLGAANAVLCGSGGQSNYIDPVSGTSSDGCKTAAGIGVYADYSTAVTFSPTALTGSTSPTWNQYAAQCSYTDTTGGNTRTCPYYKQYMFIAEVTANAQGHFDGVSTLPITGTAFGSAVTVCTIHATSDPTDVCPTGGSYAGVDAGTTVTFAAKMSGSAAYTEWCNAAGCSSSSTQTPGAGLNTYNVNYWFEIEDDYNMIAVNAASDAALGGTITFSGFMQGSAATVCSGLGSAGGSNPVCAGFTDFGSAVTATATIADGSNKRWATGTSDTIVSVFINYYYYYYLQVQNTFTGTPTTNWDAGRTVKFYGVVLGVKTIPTGCSFTPSAGTSTPLSCTVYTDYNQAVNQEDSNVVSSTVWVSGTPVTAAITTGGGTYDSSYVLLSGTSTTTTVTSTTTTATTTTSVSTTVSTTVTSTSLSFTTTTSTTLTHQTTTTETSYSTTTTTSGTTQTQTSTYVTTVNGTGTTVTQTITWQRAVPPTSQTTTSSSSTSAQPKRLITESQLRGGFLVVVVVAALYAIARLREQPETQAQKASKVLGARPPLRQVDIRRKKKERRT